MECEKCGACCRLKVLQPAIPRGDYWSSTRQGGGRLILSGDWSGFLLFSRIFRITKTVIFDEKRPEQCRLYPTRTPGLVVPTRVCF
ncbi:MAG: hypothetical protein LUQ36_05835 [Methanoregula sp.]|nr:hypothetical protein [Methanoregula sp.]